MNYQVLGRSESGQEAVLLTIQNNCGLSVTLCNFGARLIAIHAPDRDGKPADVCLGFDTLEDYQTRSGYLGATIGRWGNRIGGASFELNGKTYSLYANNGKNTLHGGKVGFDKKFWDYEVLGRDSVRFTYVSPDMEEGFPGTLKTEVTYSVEDDGSLVIDYRAVSDQDTVVNLTNHVYFNLAGKGTVHDHLLFVDADFVTGVKEDLIPDGVFIPVDNTPYDLRTPRMIGDSLEMTGISPMFDNAKGYDINYVLKGSGLREVAVLSHPASGRELRVLTDQPGVQVYSGQGLKGAAKNGAAYKPYSGIALETQHLPDSVHHPHFPTTVLKKGEEYKSRTVYRFTAK